jgi:hypothetical protein
MEPLIEYLLAMRCGTQYSDRQSLMDVLCESFSSSKTILQSLVQGKFCSLEKYDMLCLSRKSLIGSQPNSKKRTDVYFSRLLSFSYHINCYLKENVERKFNYMIKLLWEHGIFKRISFGDALWNSVLRPSISHGKATSRSTHQDIYNH